jgi:hypothetical protein
MDKFSKNESEPSPEKITEEVLISLAKEKPLRDPEVEKMFIQWLIETDVSGDPKEKVTAIDRIDAAIKHSAMKYRLGFISREEVLQELQQAGDCLASEYVDTKELHAELSQLMYDIEDDIFEVIGREG